MDTNEFLRRYAKGERNFSGIDLGGAILSAANLSVADLSAADLNAANLSAANLSGADLSAADLSGANLSAADLREADLSGADLREADLREADLSGANLSASDLRAADLRAADLSGADLSGADLRAADLSGANLSGADLSGADLSGADLSGADLSGANLSGATLTEVKQLITANLRNTNFAQAKGIKLNSVLAEVNNISPNQEGGKNLNGMNDLWQVTRRIINSEKLEFYLIEDDFKKLINMAFLVTFKKEESRYPKFQIYIRSKTDKPAHNLIVKFDEPIKINLDNISPLSRMGIGIPQKVGALVVEKENSHLQLTGIVQINNHDELFGELLESKTHLVGIFIIIENPGSIHILFNLPNGSKRQLEFTGAEVKINADAVQNPLVNICFFEIAAKIIKEKYSSHYKAEEFNKFFELIKIIQKVWHRILKLVVNRNRGGQFVIVSSNILEREDPYLDIAYFHQPNRDENYRNPIIDFFEKYYKYRTSYRMRQDSFSRDLFNDHDLLESYHNLIQYIDIIANLSTIDGNIVFDQYLNLIGFGGEVKVKDDPDSEKFKYFEYKVKTDFNTPLINQNIPNDINKLLGREELIKLLLGADYLESLDENPNANRWESKEYGTRHRSAARLCTVPDLNAFVFVVSQTGAVREFMHLAENKVLVLGPLTPL
ncbi:pentapeptide repeat-containing protein [Cylindrospermum sp. NIES-4074]|nr:pentapeptide repeat-containing protein [Cylindrospermum sp. NIES-4074]